MIIRTTPHRATQATLFLGLWLLASTTWAQVVVTAPWVRATGPGQPAAAAYMQLTAKVALRLKVISSPAAGVIELHQTTVENDVIKMWPAKALTLAAGETVRLKPGGRHFMMLKLTNPIEPGDIVPLRLDFEDLTGKKTTVNVDAEAGFRRPTKQ